MNRLEKDLLFYSNYCLHSSNLLNSISKTSLNQKVLYICIDDSKIKVPSFITRVPSVFLVNQKKVLVEDEINEWIQHTLQREQQASAPPPNMIPRQNQAPSQMSPPNNMPENTPPIKAPPVQDLRPEDEGVLAFHGNEMGANMSTSYSFIEDGGNASLNSNFSFLEGAGQETRINTPKEFNGQENMEKSKNQSEYERLLEQRNSESFAKGVQRI